MPHAINDDPDKSFEEHMRHLQPVMPALDRDQLMFRAGQKMVSRPKKTWPALAIASWAVCAGLLGVLIWRPAQVVTKTRVVERIVSVPADPVDKSVAPPSPETERPSHSAEQNPAPISHEEIWTLADLKGPLTAGGWRLANGTGFNNRPAVASTAPDESFDRVSAQPMDRPRTYGELRRALINGQWDGSLTTLF